LQEIVMINQSFDALVVEGQLMPSDALRPFEGQRVHVTLSDPIASDSGPEKESHSEPPEDFDIEKDVSVRIPLASETIVNPVIVPGRGLRPCIILPEEMINE